MNWHIEPVTKNKKAYLNLLLLADESEAMIDRYEAKCSSPRRAAKPSPHVS